MVMSWLLALGLAANPADQAAVALALAKAQRERPAPVAPTPVRPPLAPIVRPVVKTATHSHLCPNCNTEFWHADDSFGKVQDHRCPSCGAGPIWQVYRKR